MADDLTQWLEQFGLGRHAGTFAGQGIDCDVLADLSAQDLKDLGLSLGDQKRMLKALATLTDAPAAPQPGPPAAAVAVEAERRQLTVMFVDLIDSSPLAERFDPEELRQVLSIFHQACVSAIEAHEGHIAQYSGDGLLVYFGYPQAHEDDAVRAVLAGLAVIANLREANERLNAEHNVRLSLRIGVETGLVVAGEVGAGASLDRQAIVGEAPIVAARLQSLAPPDTIVVGPVTERLVQGSFLFEHMGSRRLKGVAEAIDVYRVLSRTDAVDRFEIRAGRGLTPLVGRTAELDMLRQRWRQSCDGEMRCVLLIGEPGIGKSRTLRAFRDSIGGDAHEVVSFHGSPYYRDSSFWPVLQRLQRSFGLDSRAFVEADIDRLEAALDDLGVDVKEAALILSRLLEMPTAGRYPTIDTSSRSLKQRTLNVFLAVVQAMARRKPLLLIVEDAHWIDPSTLELIRLILERLTDTPLLVLLTGRPEFKPGWVYPQLVQLHLDRLSRRDRFEMIERLTGGKALPGFVLDQIVSKTDGVPLFVEELTKAVLQGDLLRDAGGRYELNGTPQAIAIPDTLQGSLLSRLDRLEPGVKEIAQIAATIGREFDHGLLALIASRSESELQADLDRLTTEEIILRGSGSAREGVYLFRHALIQEIAYHSLLLKRRRHYHGLIVDALESHYPEVVERQPELVAQNLAASNAPERAIDYWRHAGERALSRAGYEEAIAHTQAGIRLAESLSFNSHERTAHMLPLLLVRGEAQHAKGDRGAMDTFHQAAGMARTEKLWSQFATAAMGFNHTAMFLGGAEAAAVALLEEALVAIGPAETVERCRLQSRLAHSLHMTGSFERGDELAHEAAAIARRVGDESGLLDALMSELMHIGARPLPIEEFPGRRRLLGELAEIAERVGEVPQAADLCARSLTGHLEIGDHQGFERALERFHELVRISPGQVFKQIEVGAEAMRAILAGDFALAERKAEESFELTESVDSGFLAGVYGMQMFTIRREQGRLADVAPLVKRFVDENPEGATWRPGLMLIASDLGFDAQARRTLEAMAESDFSIPMDSKRLVTWTYMAEVAARLGDADCAERITHCCCHSGIRRSPFRRSPCAAGPPRDIWAASPRRSEIGPPPRRTSNMPCR